MFDAARKDFDIYMTALEEICEKKGYSDKRKKTVEENILKLINMGMKDIFLTIANIDNINNFYGYNYRASRMCNTDDDEEDE